MLLQLQPEQSGTKQKNIFQLICFLKTKNLESELLKIPAVKEKGKKEAANLTDSEIDNCRCGKKNEI